MKQACKFLFVLIIPLLSIANILFASDDFSSVDNPIITAQRSSTGSSPSYDSSSRASEDEPTYIMQEADYATRSYQRIYIASGVGGSYFVKRGGIDIKGNVGLYGNVEYRFSKIISLGFDSYYGYAIGSGNQYLSIFSPGFKIYPLMYKNPKFEPFIFIGGHAYDAFFGGNTAGKARVAQGGFAGVGFKIMPELMPIGLEFFVRASFLSMERPAAVGGRALTIPVFSFLGVVY